MSDERFNRIDATLNLLLAGQTELRQDVSRLSAGQTELRNDVNELKDEVSTLQPIDLAVA